MDITITCTVGDATEGVVVDADLSNVLYPGDPANMRADAVRDAIRRLLLPLAHSAKTGQSLSVSAGYVDSHTANTT